MGVPIRRRDTAPLHHACGVLSSYGRCVFGNPLGLILPVLLMTVPIVLAYFVIRLAVRHGVVDAQRQLRREQPPWAHLPDRNSEGGNVISSGTPGSN